MTMPGDDATDPDRYGRALVAVETTMKHFGEKLDDVQKAVDGTRAEVGKLHLAIATTEVRCEAANNDADRRFEKIDDRFDSQGDRITSCAAGDTSDGGRGSSRKGTAAGLLSGGGLVAAFWTAYYLLTGGSPPPPPGP